MTTLLLIRHGANDWIGNALAGWKSGVHLNATGRSQAERIAQYLAHKPISQIFSSPLERAVQTAEPLAKKLGLTINLADPLGEIDFGDWTGSLIADLEPTSEWKRFCQFRSCTRPPNGKLMLEVQTRVIAQLETWRSQFADQHIAIFSHADTIRAALVYFLGMPLDFFYRLEVSPASISTVGFGVDSVQVHCLNDTSAL